MAAYSDQEQLDELRKWWADNGRSIIAGAAIGLIALFGWRGWAAYQENLAEAASLHYMALREAVTGGNTDAVIEQAGRLKEDFASTPYAALAALELAKRKAEEGELEAAEEQLRWVLDQAAQETLRYTARIRLARVLTARARPDDALALLENDFPRAYTALVEETRGDALRARGDLEAARAAYDRAIASSRGNIEYLRMKRNDLGGETPADPS